MADFVGSRWMSSSSSSVSGLVNALLSVTLHIVLKSVVVSRFYPYLKPGLLWPTSMM
jgi:hypothetical protein